MKNLHKILTLLYCTQITIASAERLTLHHESTNSTFHLNWNSNAVLQTSSNLLQWQDLRNPAPYTPALEEITAFYQLRLPDYLLINNLTNSSDAALLDWQGIIVEQNSDLIDGTWTTITPTIVDGCIQLPVSGTADYYRLSN